MLPPKPSSTFPSSEGDLSDRGLLPDVESSSTRNYDTAQSVEEHRNSNPASQQNPDLQGKYPDSWSSTTQLQLESASSKTLLNTLPLTKAIDSVNEATLTELDNKYATNHPDEILPDLEFNLSELLNIASLAMNSPCNDIELLGFGLYNKVYLLTFSDGKEAVARLPYNRATSQYRLQGDVGAMKYASARLPEKWKPLVPQIYTWNSDPQNPVGQPYVIMEKVKGQALSTQYSVLDIETKAYIAVQLAEFTSALHELGSEFNGMIGGIYCDGDGFKIGPLIRNWKSDACQWSGVDNGPWKTTPEFMRGQFRQLLSLWQVYYLPQTHSDGSRHGVKVKEVIRFIMDACSLVCKLDPRVIMGDPNADTPRAFVHTDLHTGNIFIDPETARLSGIIDWEAAGVFSEPFAVRVPKWLRGPDVYSPMTKLGAVDEPNREWFRELTILRDRYCLERGYLEGPGYHQALENYDELHKLDKCVSTNMSSLDSIELRKWVSEMIKKK